MAALVPELSVSDIVASRRFYCDVLGFAVLYERPEEGFAYLALDQAELMLDQIGEGRDWITGPLVPPLGRGANFQIEVAAIDPICARLQAAGIELFQPVETSTYRTAMDQVTQRQFCVQDPDGYLLRLCEKV
ncbi:VOC family protein [uncultured Devosia sp.]|uniref:bleomycin resistance protein n=1 Tax=uncultured Devosia sp. TaxID=211434 RepID=UPI00260E585C|nr:VOC family protein [uncultured Devosia sp.]